MYATDLIFARMGSNEMAKTNQMSDTGLNDLKKVESYGLANPISDVLKGLKIELLI